MAKGILGNEIPDTAVTIPRADYDEYQRLLNVRDLICEDIEEGRDITIPYLLKRLGGYKAIKLYNDMMNEYRGEENGENGEQHNS